MDQILSIILDWYFEHYNKYLPEERVIKYEDIIDTNGHCLSVITKKAKDLKEELTNKNARNMYKRVNIKAHKRRLLSNPDLYCWKFYSHKDVEDLFPEITMEEES